MQLLSLALLSLNLSLFAMEKTESKTNDLKPSKSSLDNHWATDLDKIAKNFSLISDTTQPPSPNNNNNNNNNQRSLAGLCRDLILLSLPEYNYNRNYLHVLDLSPKKKNKKSSIPVPTYTLEKLLRTETALKKIKHNNVASLLLQNQEIEVKLTIFNLSSASLDEIPSTIKELKNLKILDLSNNKLKSLPDDIGKLSTLKILNLANNQLTALPSTIGELKKLQQLSITDNRHLSALPEAMIGMLALVELHGIYFKERKRSQKTVDLDSNSPRTNRDLLKIPDIEYLPHISQDSQQEIKLKKRELAKTTPKFK